MLLLAVLMRPKRTRRTFFGHGLLGLTSSELKGAFGNQRAQRDP